MAASVRSGERAPGAMVRLGVMMFLEFFVWGAWAVPMGKYLATLFSTEGRSKAAVDMIIGQAYSTSAIAAIIAPLFVGLVADRFLPGQVVLGGLHLLNAGLLFAVARATDPTSFYWLLLAAGLCYMPTLALVNSVSFDQLDEPQKQFPLVRVWGTIGWIAAGITVGSLLPRILAAGGLPAGIEPLVLGDAGGGDAGKTNLPFLLAAAVSAVLGLYSFTLPHSPPKAKGEPVSVAKLLGLDAVGLLKSPAFATFAVASFLICIPLAVYYSKANEYISGMKIQEMLGLGSETVMTFGQMSEIGFMLLMPLFLSRYGVKTMLIGGMLAWVLRYLLFAYGASSAWMLVAAVVLHGICYDFFFVTGQLYTDHVAPKSMRASAQGLIALLTYGAGMYVGNLVFPEVARSLATTADVYPWKPFWIAFAIAAAAVMAGFAIAFRDPVKLGRDEAG
jgi:nucleoside transporter